MQIKELLIQGRHTLIKNNIEDASIVARVLLQFVLNMDQIELLQKDAKQVSQKQKQDYEIALQKIIEGTPLQYITKKQEFYGLSFYVDDNVLIPQPDTEVLVEKVLNIAKTENKGTILDICTGSGAIGISLAHNLPNASITMSDISLKAIEIAKRNSKQNEVLNKVTLIQSNLFEKIEGDFDIIVSNPPYIQTNIITTLSKQVQREPHLALDGGEDGLFFYRKLLNEAPNYLKAKGYLCMEIGYEQKEAVMQLAQETGKYEIIEAKQDFSGNDRVIICKK